MSIPKIEAARIKLLQNASDLLVEAQLLFSAKHFPRAYTLAHIALEEVSKLAPLVASAARHELGLPADVKELNHKLTSHKKKIAMASKLLRTLSSTGAKTSIHESLMVPDASPEHVNRANDLKNRSLYCGFREGEFETPSDNVTELIAAVAIAEASTLVGTIRRAETQAAGRKEEILKDPNSRGQLMYLFRLEARRLGGSYEKQAKSGHHDAHTTAPGTPPPFFISLKACLYFEQSIELLVSSLTVKQVGALRAALLAVATKEDFVHILANVAMLARERGLVLPPVGVFRNDERSQ